MGRRAVERLLMGPGPSNVAPEVLAALAEPTIGHLDPEFAATMTSTVGLLRLAFETANELTFPVSGTGSAGMEAAIVNFVQPGDRVVICVAGVFGERLADCAGRVEAEVVRVDAEWGRAADPDQVRDALASGPTHVLICVHAETSTGARQQLEPLHRCLLQRHSEVPGMSPWAGTADSWQERIGVAAASREPWLPEDDNAA